MGCWEFHSAHTVQLSPNFYDFVEVEYFQRPCFIESMVACCLEACVLLQLWGGEGGGGVKVWSENRQMTFSQGVHITQHILYPLYFFDSAATRPNPFKWIGPSYWTLGKRCFTFEIKDTNSSVVFSFAAPHSPTVNIKVLSTERSCVYLQTKYILKSWGPTCDSKATCGPQTTVCNGNID